MEATAIDRSQPAATEANLLLSMEAQAPDVSEQQTRKNVLTEIENGIADLLRSPDNIEVTQLHPLINSLGLMGITSKELTDMTLGLRNLALLPMQKETAKRVIEFLHRYLDPHWTVSPLELYQLTLREIRERYYAPEKLAILDQCEYRCKARIFTSEDAISAANECLSLLKDRYTRLISPEELRLQEQMYSGAISGIGLSFDVRTDETGKPAINENSELMPIVSEDGYPLVATVQANTPAERAGMVPNDAILSIDGQCTRKRSLQSLISLLRGDLGKSLHFVVRKAVDEEDITLTESITLIRETIEVSPVVHKDLDGGNIAYVQLKDFMHKQALRDMLLAMMEHSSAKALILDLRFNPGGDIGQTLAIASLFVEKGTLVSTSGRIVTGQSQPVFSETIVRVNTDTTIQQIYNAADPSDVDTKVQPRSVPYLAAHRPIVVLVNAMSASGSELTAYALRESAGATVIGTKTAGKGVGQSVWTMPNGCKLHFTNFRYFSPNGNWAGDGNSELYGVEPDVHIEQDKPFIKLAGPDDNQLDCAVRFIQERFLCYRTRLVRIV